MPSLNIKVGASVDRSLAVAYRPVIESAKRAAAAIEAENRKAARAIERETKRSEKEREKAFQATARAAERWQKEQLKALEKAVAAEKKTVEKAEREKVREAEKAAADMARIRERSATMAGRFAAKQAAEEARARKMADAEAARSMEKRLREAKRTEEKKDRDYGNLATRGGRALIGVTKAAAGAALSVAGGLARSQGVDLDVVSMMSKNADLETVASQTANSGYMAGDKRNGQRVDASELMRDALKIGAETGTGANDIMEGLSKFVGLTGDLKTGRETLKEMAVLAKATGSSFEDMAAATGNVAMALPDTADKGQKVQAVMRAVAGMGKVGAVEIKDLASQMAKLSANAGSFTGDADKNMITLAAMAQESRAVGGSASATQAATSVASFVSMLKTPARAKAFEAATGTSVIDKKTNKLKDPQQIIKEALAAVGTDPIKLKAIFANVQGSRAMEGFAQKFRDAGGGKAGLDAVDAEFDRLKKAAMAEQEIAESFARSMKTGQSQAEVFNNQIRLSALEIQGALLPALVSLAPMVVEATKTFSGVVSWLTGDKQMERIGSKATGDVEAVRKSIETQVAGGKVSEATVEESRVATAEAFEAKSRARAELVTANENKMGSGEKAALKAMDFLLSGGVVERIFGGKIGEAKIDKEKEDIRAKEQKVQEFDRLYQQANETNKMLLQKITDGIVVKVSNLNEISPSGVPGVPGGGRTPSPEENAGGSR